MSSSPHFTIMSQEQARTYHHEVVTKFLMYFPISQIVCGVENWSLFPILPILSGKQPILDGLRDIMLTISDCVHN